MLRLLKPVLVLLGVLGGILLTSSALAGERPELKDTSYPIPRGAVFVSTKGSDRNPGTRKRPLRSVGSAIPFTPEGGTIVIRGGTYRETLPDLAKRLTLQPYPHEKVWLKGSEIVEGWVRDGNAWRRNDWKPDFCRDCFHPGNIDPDFPNAGQPDQVFIDGEPLRQVAVRSELSEGTFFVDHKRHRLYLGTSPSGKNVEASVHGTALTIWQNGHGSIIRGLGFAHYAPASNHGTAATLKVSADQVRLENNTFAFSAAKGVEVFGRNVQVRGNTFLRNGWIGLAAWKADGLKVRHNRFARNNREMFMRTGPVSGAAGASITATREPVVSDNLFDGNHSNGLWFDISVTKAIVSRNIMRNNLRHGLFYEISSHGVIASNIMSGNGLGGIALSDSAHMQVYNNTLYGNMLALIVQDGDRVNDNPAEIADGSTWISADTSFHNNLLSGSPKSNYPYVWVRDFTGKQRADNMLTVSDSNAFYRQDPSQPSHLVEWWRGPKRALFANLNQFRSATGRDRNSAAVEGTSIDPFFQDAVRGNFALKPRSAARLAGRTIPPDVAKAIGISNRHSPNLGALLLPGGRPVTPE
ncbi:MAG: right-handed parallel beta-helix repeat-containing protein [Pseudomonadota bacterium]